MYNLCNSCRHHLLYTRQFLHHLLVQVLGFQGCNNSEETLPNGWFLWPCGSMMVIWKKTPMIHPTSEQPRCSCSMLFGKQKIKTCIDCQSLFMKAMVFQDEQYEKPRTTPSNFQHAFPSFLIAVALLLHPAIYLLFPKPDAKVFRSKESSPNGMGNLMVNKDSYKGGDIWYHNSDNKGWEFIHTNPATVIVCYLLLLLLLSPVKYLTSY